MNLSLTEKETIILFNEEPDGKAVCFTYNGRLKKRLIGLCDSYDECKMTKENKHGAMQFEFPKQWIKINPPPKREFTEEQRQAIAERLKRSRLKNSQGESLHG